MKSQKTKLDLIILLIYPIIAFSFSVFFQINVFNSIIAFFVLPSLYLAVRDKKDVPKALFFSLFGIPFMLMIDFIAHLTRTWIIPKTIFDFRFLGFVSVEVLFWMFMFVFLTVMFYEHFFDGFSRKKIYKRTKYFVWLLFILTVVFCLSFTLNTDYLKIPYFYSVAGVVLMLIPPIVFLFRYPEVFSKIFKTSLYLFYLNFLYEIAALKLGWWGFPGNEYVGWVTFLDVRFPFEELFFYVITGGVWILSYYEFFDDDCK